MDWFLYDNSLRHERVNLKMGVNIATELRCIQYWYFWYTVAQYQERFTGQTNECEYDARS